MSSPKLAAVTILHRGAKGDLEVFWVRRNDTLAFLGGFWAFPGGRAEAGESLVEAAARELREETGVEIADPTRFVPAGVTITPEWAPIRFEATYFLVEAPPGAAPDHRAAGGEHTDGEWIRPAEALARWSRGERLTSPVVTRIFKALLPGLDGAIARVQAEAEWEQWSSRVWDLLPGLAVAWLRTPTLPPATHTNCYLVGGDRLIVIDPASPYPEEREALDRALDDLAKQGRRVGEIWLTHHHVDHVSGAAHLAQRLGVPVAAHAETKRLVEGRIEVARLLADDEVEVLPAWGDIPERRLRCLFTPGHAPGHHCYLEETSGFVIAGDMVAGIGTIVIDPDEGDMAQYLASLARLRALPPRALLPAHGQVLTDPIAKLDEYTNHRLWREARVRDALIARGEATAADLVPDVYSDVAPALFALAERSLLSHLVKLVKDGAVLAHERGRFTPANR